MFFGPFIMARYNSQPGMYRLAGITTWERVCVLLMPSLSIWRQQIWGWFSHILFSITGWRWKRGKMSQRRPQAFGHPVTSVVTTQGHVDRSAYAPQGSENSSKLFRKRERERWNNFWVSPLFALYMHNCIQWGKTLVLGALLPKKENESEAALWAESLWALLIQILIVIHEPEAFPHCPRNSDWKKQLLETAPHPKPYRNSSTSFVYASKTGWLM